MTISNHKKEEKKQIREPLSDSLYLESAVDVAPKLVGAHIRMGDIELEILETEAYMPDDSACHAHKGQTPRTVPMFDRGGRIYVYLCYGIHVLLNVVTGSKGSGQAVLIRAARVIEGEELVLKRRKGRLDLIGPGKVGQALGLSVQDSGRNMGDWFNIYPSQRTTKIRVRAAKRVGIDYAKPKDRDALWRFILDETSA
jgi:DNA-3-methyladenine glycosylase